MSATCKKPHNEMILIPNFSLFTALLFAPTMPIEEVRCSRGRGRGGQDWPNDKGKVQGTGAAGLQRGRCPGTFCGLGQSMVP